jgi:hypothetical protein
MLVYKHYAWIILKICQDEFIVDFSLPSVLFGQLEDTVLECLNVMAIDE